MTLKPTFDTPLKSCCICKSADISHYKTDYQGIRIFKCGNCKTQFMNPQYTDQYMTDFYNEYQNRDVKHHKYGDIEEPRVLGHLYNITELEKYTEKGKFLSVGTGNGFDLKIAKERGWQAEGFDVDESFVAGLSSKLGVEIKSGSFVEIPYPENYFSCVYLNHVLEHPKNPGEYLGKIQKILKPGGILFIACPNIHSFSHSLKNLMESLGLKKKVGKHYDTWHHLFYYGAQQLKKVLETYYQFKVVKVGNDLRIEPDTTEIKESALDGFTYKSSFRLFAKKV